MMEQWHKAPSVFSVLYIKRKCQIIAPLTTCPDFLISLAFLARLTPRPHQSESFHISSLFVHYFVSGTLVYYFLYLLSESILHKDQMKIFQL